MKIVRCVVVEHDHYGDGIRALQFSTEESAIAHVDKSDFTSYVIVVRADDPSVVEVVVTPYT